MRPMPVGHNLMDRQAAGQLAQARQPQVAAVTAASAQPHPRRGANNSAAIAGQFGQPGASFSRQRQGIGFLQHLPLGALPPGFQPGSLGRICQAQPGI